MYNTDLEFQSIFFLCYGILFGGISGSLLLTILLIIIYEYYVFHVSNFYQPKVREYDRIFVNLIFLLGWILGRVLLLNETGFEDIFENLRFEN